MKLETAHTLDPNGNIEKTVNPRGYATYFAYDIRNLVTQRKNALLHTTDHTYDENGNRVKTVNAVSHGTYFYYNAVDRQKGSYEYVGVQKLETYFEFDEAGNTTKIVDARLNTTTMAYTALNQLESRTNALDESTYYTYDENGNRLTVKDPLAHTTTSVHDELNRLTCSTDPIDAKTYFTYDAVGNRTKIKDAEGNETDYVYDAANQLTSMTNALSQVEAYTYNDNGDLSTSEDPDNRTTNLHYDELDRQTCVEYPDGVSHYYTYDGNDNMTGAQDARDWTALVYDDVDRLTSETAPDSVVVAHTYDDISRRIEVRTLLNSTYYAYDEANRMTAAQAENTTAGTASYTVDANGNVTQKTLGNASYTDIVYDVLNRPTSIDNCLSDDTVVADFDHTYDDAGRITKCVRESGDVVYYTYDDANRLTSEVWKDSDGTPLHEFEWTLDLVGNRTYQKYASVETYYEHNAGNELTKLHVVPADEWTYFTHDSRGNCTRIVEPDGTTYFTYGDADLVTTIHYKDDVMNRFWYNAQLQRHAMEDSSGLSYFTWDRNGMNLLAVRDSSGTTTAEFTHGSTPIDGIGSTVAVKRTDAGSTYYQFPMTDHRGSVVRLVDENENVTAYYEYNAYGQELRDDVVGGTGENPLRYQSNWLGLKDSDGTLFLTPTRLYHAPLGRFLQRDPKGYVDGYNLYEAFGNQASVALDPSGGRSIVDKITIPEIPEPEGDWAKIRMLYAQKMRRLWVNTKRKVDAGQKVFFWPRACDVYDDGQQADLWEACCEQLCKAAVMATAIMHCYDACGAMKAWARNMQATVLAFRGAEAAKAKAAAEAIELERLPGEIQKLREKATPLRAVRAELLRRITELDPGKGAKAAKGLAPGTPQGCWCLFLSDTCAFPLVKPSAESYHTPDN